MCVVNIDKVLSAGNFHSLVHEITDVQDFADLLSVDLDSSYQQSADDTGTMSVPLSLDDDPVHACCSCECLHQRKSVTKVNLSDNLGSMV